MPRKAACPNETSPVCPTSSSRLSAKMARIIIFVTRSMPNRLPMSGNSASAASSTRPARTEKEVEERTGSGTPEQPFRAPQQDRGHQHVDEQAGSLREEDRAEGLDESDEHRRQQRAADRADAADDDDDEADDQHLVAHAGI